MLSALQNAVICWKRLENSSSNNNNNNEYEEVVENDEVEKERESESVYESEWTSENQVRFDVQKKKMAAVACVYISTLVALLA